MIAGLGATVLRKGEEALAATAEGGDEAGYATARSPPCAPGRRDAALIVFIIFLMTAKPF